MALWVDDLQWTDVPSLRWLAYLARRLESAPACVLATLRPLEQEDAVLTELLVDPVVSMLVEPLVPVVPVLELL